MASAFDEPPGTADFSRMSAPNQNRLVIGDVLHKTFLDLDEKGTEAAAATAVVMLKATSIPGKPQEPVVVRVNRPFLFAIQHVQSGTCLFLGRLQKP
jgi:serpin B